MHAQFLSGHDAMQPESPKTASLEMEEVQMAVMPGGVVSEG